MTVEEALKQIEILEAALKQARSPEEIQSILFEIDRLKRAKLEN